MPEAAYSHFDLIAEPDHDVSVLSETPAILKDVIELIRRCDEGLCKSMIEVTTATWEIARAGIKAPGDLRVRFGLQAHLKPTPNP